MLRTTAEWVWRLAILAAVLWADWEVAQLREDFADPGDDPAETATSVRPS